MNNSLGMEVIQAIEDLSGKVLCQIIDESTLLSQVIGDRTTRNVFKETVEPQLAVCQ